MININGYGDELTVNDVRIGDLSPKEHEQIEKEKGGQNYSPLEDVVVSHVKDSSTLICRKPSENEIDSYVEEELLDGLCCYSAVNQGQLNETIVNAVINHLKKVKPCNLYVRSLSPLLTEDQANQIDLDLRPVMRERYKKGLSKNGIKTSSR